MLGLICSARICRTRWATSPLRSGGGRPAAATAGLGLLGVDDHEGAEDQVSLEIDGGAAQLLDAIRGDDDRQAVVVLDDVVGSGVLEEWEGRGALVLAARDPDHLDLEREALGVGLLGADPEHLLPGQVGDPNDRLPAGDVIGGHGSLPARTPVRRVTAPS